MFSRSAPPSAPVAAPAPAPFQFMVRGDPAAPAAAPAAPAAPAPFQFMVRGSPATTPTPVVPNSTSSPTTWVPTPITSTSQ